MTEMERLQRDEEHAYLGFEESINENHDDLTVRSRAAEYRAAGDTLAHAYVTEIHRIERTQSEVAEKAARALGERG